jgi:pimeloyl-ACP methyl ester carboxylesterase
MGPAGMRSRPSYRARVLRSSPRRTCCAGSRPTPPTSPRSSPSARAVPLSWSATPTAASSSPNVLDLAGYPGGPDGDVEAFRKPDTVHEAFAQDLPQTDCWLVAASQQPLTLSACNTPSATAPWKTLPSWAVVGTQDRIIPPDTQRHMAQRAGATITDVDSSHVSMVSHPQVTIDAILAASLPSVSEPSRPSPGGGTTQ